MKAPITRNLLGLGAILLGACSDGSQRDDGAGSLRLALSNNGPLHDVSEVRFEIVDAADPDGCAGAVLAQSSAAIEAEPLPSSLDPDGGGGDLHPFADALFVLPPGAYRACATPLDAASSPSSECAPTESLASVVAQETTEIVLISQCQGDPNGGIDVVVGLNDPPRIENLDVTPSKFIETCEIASLSATATDPNGDSLSYGWSVDAAPAGANPSLGDDGLGGATFETDLAGDYELSVVVADAHGAEASLSFPIHVSPCSAPGTALWTQTFDGGQHDAGSGVATDAAGNVYVAGTTGFSSTILLVKYDSAGTLLWTRSAVGGQGHAVATDAAGNVIVAGESSGSATSPDVWVGKYDADGTLLWAQSFDGGSLDRVSGVATDAGGNIVVAGDTINANFDVWVRKYDSSGAVLWTDTFDESSSDHGRGVAIDAAGDAIVAGSTSGGGWLRKYDPAGGVVWTSTFPASFLEDVAVDAAGNVLVAGSNNSATQDIRVGKLDSSGSLVWARTFDGGNQDNGFGVASDGAGNVIATGQSHNGANVDVWVQKYDPDGTELWNRTFDGGSTDAGNGVTTDAGDAIYVCGNTFGTTVNLWLRKYAP